jgi:hypothetical protein
MLPSRFQAPPWRDGALQSTPTPKNPIRLLSCDQKGNVARRGLPTGLIIPMLS